MLDIRTRWQKPEPGQGCSAVLVIMEERLTQSGGDLNHEGTQNLVTPGKCPLKQSGEVWVLWFFFSFFPPSIIFHGSDSSKAIVKGAGKCGFQEKGAGINLEAKGKNQNSL